MTTLAQQIEGVRTVSGSTERDLLFPAPSNGQKVYNVTTDSIEYWNGSAWVTIAPTLPASGRTMVSLAAYLANNALFNIVDYGADRTGVADSRAAIALADAAAVAAGGLLVVPYGTFKISSAITISAPTWFQGGKLSADVAIIVSLSYLPIAPPRQIFAGSGSYRLGASAAAWVDTPAHDCAPPDWWGGSGNTGSYDTVAVQAAFDSGFPIRFARHYYVTSVLLEGSQKYVDFAKYRLVAVSSSSNTDYCLGLQCYQSTLRRISVQAVVGTSGLKYKSLVRIFGDASHTNIQFNNFEFDSLENVAGVQLSAALVIGAHIGNTPYNTPISENTIRNLTSRGVEAVVYCNQPNGKNTFVGCHAVVSQNEWSGSDWSAARACAIRNEPTNGAIGGGEIEWHGGSIENNESNAGTGYGIRGNNLRIHGAVWEISTTNLIEGDRVSIFETLNDAVGAFNASGKAAFTIAAGATGRLLLRNVFQNRSTDAAGACFVDGTLATDFLVVIATSDLKGYRWTHSTEYSPLIKGCRVKFDGPTRFRNAAGTVDIDINGADRQSILTGFDCTGAVFPAATMDQTAKGGWTHATGGAAGNRFGIAVDGPTGFTNSIEVQSIAGQTSQITTPTGTSGFPVSALKSALARLWLKILTNGSALRISVLWYKRDGTACGTASSDIVNVATSSTLGLTLSTWYRITQFVQAPWDAQFAALQVYVDNDTDIRVADLRMD
jgi:hypothetical protein